MLTWVVCLCLHCSLTIVGHCSAHSILVPMPPIHSLYHASVLFCVSVFTDDGGHMATEMFEYFVFNVIWLV